MKKNTFIRDISQVGLMVALLEVTKLAISFLPNIEVTSFLIIMFTLYFGKKIFFALPVFIIIEGVIYGFGIWWIMYLYIWPLLAVMTLLLHKKASHFSMCVLSSLFGLFFGALCSLPYFFLGVMENGFMHGIKLALSFWVAGIVFDVVHCIGNTLVMLVLYKPVGKVFGILQKNGF